MLIKRRGQRLAVYRSRWIPKGDGVPHGYSAQEYLGSLEADALSIPQSLRERLTAEEVAQLEEKVCRPARDRRRLAEEQERRKELDPVWRLQAARDLVAQAAVRSAQGRVSRYHVEAVQVELAKVQMTSSAQSTVVSNSHQDALLQAVKAVQAAAQVVRSGAYGKAPAQGVRETRTYRRWAELVEALDGGSGSLLRALQDQGFVKTRKG